MAHKESQEIIERHLTFWINENSNIIFTCPKDSPVISDYHIVCIGGKGHHNESAIR